MEEKRIYKREQLICYLQVVDSSSGEKLGNLIDLSLEGIKLMTESPLRTGATYHVDIRLNKEVQGKKVLSVKAACKWCRKESNADYYDAGLELPAQSEEQTSLIESVIEAFCFKQGA